MRKPFVLRKLLTMGKLLTFVLILLMTMQFTSCKKNNDIPESPEPTSYSPTVIDNSSTNNETAENNSGDNNETANDLMSNTAAELGITHQNYPKIDGSTSTLEIVRAINRAMYKSVNNENFNEAE